MRFTFTSHKQLIIFNTTHTTNNVSLRSSKGKEVGIVSSGVSDHNETDVNNVKRVYHPVHNSNLSLTILHKQFISHTRRLISAGNSKSQNSKPVPFHSSLLLYTVDSFIVVYVEMTYRVFLMLDLAYLGSQVGHHLSCSR